MPLDRPAASMPPVVLRSVSGQERVLTAEALCFLADLNSAFAPQLQALLAARKSRQHDYGFGQLPELLAETTNIRRGMWQATPVPRCLFDRRVEITGPVDRRTMISTLNSGAKTFVADFEDTTLRHFDAMIAGQVNLLDYRDGNLSYTDPKIERSHALMEAHAVLIVRPRGLHLQEENLLIGGQSISAALFDFALHIFHNGKALAESGRGPFYDLRGLENHCEARFWNAVFLWAQDRIGLVPGTIKATVLIDTLSAAFEMDETIWELREHIAALSFGHLEIIFSYIKTLGTHEQHVLPDRTDLAMSSGFLAAVSAHLVQTCHRRGIHAIGSMAAANLTEGCQTANEAIFARITTHKMHEVQLGYDGSRVASPNLVPVTMQVFDAEMRGHNQIRCQRQEYRITPAMLLKPHEGHITEAGVRTNTAVAIEYLAQCRSGRKAAPNSKHMEEVATAEICQAQLWQWLRHGAAVTLAAGGERCITADWLGELVRLEIDAILNRLGPTGFHRGQYASAARILHEAATSETLPNFINDLLNTLE